MIDLNLNDTDTLFRKFMQNGVAVVEDFFYTSEVARIKDELMPHYEKMQDGDMHVYGGKTQEQGYSYGKLLRITDKGFPDFKALSSTFNERWFKDFTDRFFGIPNVKNLQTFCTWEYLTPEKAQGATRNSHPHIDPYFALKYFIYLTDTRKENGAFKVIKGSHIDGGNYRLSQPLEHLTKEGYKLEESGLNFSESQMEYVEANAGALVIVNTDAIHAGGVIREDNLDRMTVMNHNRKY